MACIWIQADNGCIWKLSETGKGIGRISAKFKDDYCNKTQYQKKVPEGWVRLGWVEQVRSA